MCNSVMKWEASRVPASSQSGIMQRMANNKQLSFMCFQLCRNRCTLNNKESEKRKPVPLHFKYHNKKKLLRIISVKCDPCQ
ncbi:hypothetical protein NDU88_001331 [Pleurodeles waltl]|uniref:Uncharacterized protein n=1 Tax=Pleurodeles waltl TaxID=8319 RepID=A0AAV7Q9T2_PLEWA|nr:hypothetical protein NDU88_001331 [Pleurodeles waltl]